MHRSDFIQKFQLIENRQMVKTLKYSLRFLGVVGLLLISVLLFWIGWMRWRPPLQFLRDHAQPTEVIIDSTYTVNLGVESRTFEDYVLHTDRLDSIQFTISFPRVMAEKQYPVLLILGGLEIGSQSLKYIPYHGENVLIGYQYPYSPTYWYKNSPVTQVPKIQSAAFAVPGQIATLGKWIQGQTWASNAPINLLGYSFGAMFLPATYHLTHADSGIFSASILAYGGADLFQLFRANLELPEPFKSLGAWLLETAVYPLEPLRHTGYMKGQFLLINGRYDEQIPEICWRKLQEAVPDPKTIIVMEEGHMNPKNPDLTLQIVKYSQQWLVENGSINTIPWYE